MKPALLFALLLAPAAASAGTLTLSPAVIPLRGELGQSTTQALTLANDTDLDLDFELVAQDVVIREGRRVFVDAGDEAGSIARTAVFSPRSVRVAVGRSAVVRVTLTLSPDARHRAVVALFRGVTRIGGGPTPATASLGTLLTFTTSEAASLAASDLVVHSQTDVRNLTFQESFANDGTEPVVARGIAVVLDQAGALVGKVPFETRRLLPGERATLEAEFVGELPAGRYRALSTFQYEGRAVTRAAQFEVR